MFIEGSVMSVHTKGKESSSSRETIALFWHHAWCHPGYVIALIVGMPMTVLLHQFIPQLIVAQVLGRLSTGQFQPHNLWGSFGQDIVLFALVFFAGNVVAWRSMIVIVWKLEAHVLYDMSTRIFSQLMRLSADFHASHFGGSLVSQATRLGDAYVRFAETTVYTTYVLVLALFYTAVILAPRAPLFVLALLLFAVLYIATTVIASPRIRALTAKEASAHSRHLGYLSDAVTNILAVKSFATENEERQHFALAAREVQVKTLDVMRATVKRDTTFSTTSVAAATTALAFAVIGVAWFRIDIGTVFLMITYTMTLLRSLWDFSANALRNYNRSFGDAAGMVAILSLSPDIQDPANPGSPRIRHGKVVFDRVDFTYAGTKEALFTHFTLTIKPGEKIGLVGHSGSGKTTLAKLLLRFVDPDNGKVTIDGQNIAKITQSDLRSRIAYVPQEPLLFHRTIRENIAYGASSATDQEVSAAARRAYADGFIEKLPHGYDTTVGERGVTLSGGQRQRIAIARAMLRKTPILVLDEATSALDSESERYIQDAIDTLMKGRTTIAIAHRLSTIQKMDRIIVFEDGKVIEQGNHKELLAQKGYYAKLWKHQSGDFLEE
jgi:ATP-binding cassette subfamily B protein